MLTINNYCVIIFFLGQCIVRVLSGASGHGRGEVKNVHLYKNFT